MPSQQVKPILEQYKAASCVHLHAWCYLHINIVVSCQLRLEPKAYVFLPHARSLSVEVSRSPSLLSWAPRGSPAAPDARMTPSWLTLCSMLRSYRAPRYGVSTFLMDPDSDHIWRRWNTI